MANEYAVNSADLTAVADAIREKSGTSEALSFPDGFVASVGAIVAGGENVIDEFIVNMFQGKATGIFTCSATIIDSDIAKFRNTDITAVHMPNLKRTTSGANQTFSNCQKLVDIQMPELEVSGAVQMFNWSKNIERVVFPKLYSIEYQAFESCTSLLYFEMGGDIANTTILAKTSKINAYTFNGASSLSAVVIRQKSKIVSLSSTSAFSSTPISSGTGYIYVPSALVDDYKVDTNWATYADQIRAIEDYPEITGG